MDKHRIEHIEQWVSCSECDSDDVAVTSPNYYTSVFECQACGERIEHTW